MLACSPFYSHMDFAIVKGVEKSLDEDRPLEGKGGDQEIESHPTEAVAFQESHQETKAKENHDVDVLEACRRGRVSRGRKERLQGLHAVGLPALAEPGLTS